MISKERLEELIEKEATIWAVYDENRIEKIKLVVRMFGISVDEYNKLHDCEPMLYSQFCGIFKDICPISWLFETKSEAEEYAEFGNITRMEKLELPMWEEIKHDFIDNKQSGGNYCVKEFLGKDQEYSLDIVVYNGEVMVSVSDEDFYEPLTKENYILACRKCKELFLGEQYAT